VPKRVRVRISRKRNEDDEGKNKFYSLVQHIPVDSYKGLQTENNTGKWGGAEWHIWINTNLDIVMKVFVVQIYWIAALISWFKNWST